MRLSLILLLLIAMAGTWDMMWYAAGESVGNETCQQKLKQKDKEIADLKKRLEKYENINGRINGKKGQATGQQDRIQ